MRKRRVYGILGFLNVGDRFYECFESPCLFVYCMRAQTRRRCCEKKTSSTLLWQFMTQTRLKSAHIRLTSASSVHVMVFLRECTTAIRQVKHNLLSLILFILVHHIYYRSVLVLSTTHPTTYSHFWILKREKKTFYITETDVWWWGALVFLRQQHISRGRCSTGEVKSMCPVKARAEIIKYNTIADIKRLYLEN